MKKLLNFDTMLTPKIITFLYYLALICVLIGGVYTIFSDSIWKGLLVIVFGVAITRVYSEFMIVIFKMNEALQEIRKK
ncbi:MAG: DUF4282 domain-containing protein [Candidatus Accumulibacter sp.]|jgi:prepilin signal peptidase PulO-like enzyme (type II secretory pathway)|nr:DUF4282 domain-containing protein [Accumulibacter sp.]